MSFSHSPLTPSVSITSSTVPLCRKAATHDSEIRHLYEEMEAQIKNEKDRLLLKVQCKQPHSKTCLEGMCDLNHVPTP